VSSNSSRGKTPRGDGGAAKKANPEDPSASPLPPSVAEKKVSGVSVAVVDYLSGLRLAGSQRVLGALSITLAEGIEAAPLYAQSKIARELREILGELAEAEVSEANLSLLEGLKL
jgi:hypothetical protein